jgi:hypothetical protein
MTVIKGAMECSGFQVSLAYSFSRKELKNYVADYLLIRVFINLTRSLRGSENPKDFLQLDLYHIHFYDNIARYLCLGIMSLTTASS